MSKSIDWQGVQGTWLLERSDAMQAARTLRFQQNDLVSSFIYRITMKSYLIIKLQLTLLSFCCSCSVRTPFASDFPLSLTLVLLLG